MSLMESCRGSVGAATAVHPEQLCLRLTRSHADGDGEAAADAGYTPAGAAPVRLLVEAEASPAFLRRARV